MLKKLREIDAESAARLHSNDKKRIVRAMEAYMITGKTISEHDVETKAVPPRYNTLKIAITFSERNELYARINRRVDGMMLRGLEDEVNSLLSRGVPCSSTSMQAIGYKEISAAIINRSDMSSAVEKVKMESRRYAKRQLTWLRRDDEIKWVTRECLLDVDSTTQIILELFNEAK